jgi:hypothetical protein
MSGLESAQPVLIKDIPCHIVNVKLVSGDQAVNLRVPIVKTAVGMIVVYV